MDSDVMAPNRSGTRVLVDLEARNIVRVLDSGTETTFFPVWIEVVS